MPQPVPELLKKPWRQFRPSATNAEIKMAPTHLTRSACCLQHSISAALAVPDNFFLCHPFFMDTGFKIRLTETGTRITAYKLHVPASGIRSSGKHQSARIGSVYKSQHINIFSIFLLTPEVRQGKK
jgi:hypothetical protein